MLNFKILGVLDVFDGVEFISTIKIQTLSLQDFWNFFCPNSSYFWPSGQFLYLIRRPYNFSSNTGALSDWEIVIISRDKISSSSNDNISEPFDFVLVMECVILITVLECQFNCDCENIVRTQLLAVKWCFQFKFKLKFAIY